MNEEQIREIIQSEVSRFATIFIEEVARTRLRADGALNQTDFYETIKFTLDRYERGE